MLVLGELNTMLFCSRPAFRIKQGICSVIQSKNTKFVQIPCFVNFVLLDPAKVGK